MLRSPTLPSSNWSAKNYEEFESSSPRFSPKKNRKTSFGPWSFRSIRQLLRGSPWLLLTLLLATSLLIIRLRGRDGDGQSVSSKGSYGSRYLPHRVPKLGKPKAKHPKGGIRKAVVLASHKAQNVTWTQSISDEWEVARMVLDDPDPGHPGFVPRNQGREAIAYLTYIVDNYNDFPNYAVFSHGHFRSWHQPETITSKLRALNLTALEQEQYIPLRCKDSFGCGQGEGLWYREPHFPVLGRLPAFWKIFFPDSEVKEPVSGVGVGEYFPEVVRYKCCGQFAVSRDAVWARSLTEWERIRAPLLRGVTSYDELRDISEMIGGNSWNMGIVYEALWQMLFGKGADYCPPEDHCRNVHFSNSVSCDWYATFAWDFTDNDMHMDCEDIWEGKQIYDDNSHIPTGFIDVGDG